MIVPEFIRFYQGYTVSSVLAEFATTFFSLVNSMYRLQADETINRINETAIGMAETKDRSNAIEKLQKQAKGIHGIVEEVKTVERVKK